MSSSIQSSPVLMCAPASSSLASTASSVSARAPRARTLPPVIAAATRKVPVSMRSGSTSYSRAVQALDALDDHGRVPAPSICAPMAIRQLARSTTSGSCAAFSITVVPCGQRGGHQDVLGAGDGDHVHHDARALEPLGARLDVAVLDRNVGAQRLQAADMLVHRARTDRAATGQRHLGLAEARDQRTQHQDRGAHGAHQVVRARRRCWWCVGSTCIFMRSSSTSCTPIRPSSSMIVVTSCRCGTLPMLTGSSASRQAAQDRQHGVLRAGNADLAVERQPPLIRILAMGSFLQ